jgi:fimbrial isopeptide formation D2 family protein/LPXTG-motif cell wall-anchored protein
MKKRLQKLLSAVVALTMLMGSLSICAAANDNEIDTQSDTSTTVKHIYELYQIFTGTYDGTAENSTDSASSTLSDLKWGKNGTGTQGEDVPSDIIKALTGVGDESKYTDQEQLAVIKQYADLTDPYRGANDQPTKSGTTYVYSNVEPGYYLIKDQDGSLTGKNATYTLYVVKVVKNQLVFEPKGSTPTVDKKIIDNGEKSANEAAIGETINYQITGRISSQVGSYNTYYYEFKDTLSKGLTFDGTDSVNVKLYFSAEDTTGVDVTKYFYKGATAQSDGTTVIKVAMQDMKQLENLKDLNITLSETTRVVLTYTAKLNENAVVNGPNENKVVLIYSNDPNTSGDGKNPGNPPENPEEPKPTTPTGETVESKTETYTTGLYITKTNSEGDRLSGAEFTLTGTNIVQVKVATKTEFVEITDENPASAGEAVYYELKSGAYTKAVPDDTNKDAYADTEKTYKMVTTTELVTGTAADGTYKVVGTVDASSGVIYFVGLGAGTYTLSETKTPAGYNTMDDVTFTVSFNADTKTFTSTHDSIKFDSNDGLFHEVAINYPGSSLPHTGGIGTTIFYALGSILLLGSAVLLVVRKRMKNEA